MLNTIHHEIETALPARAARVNVRPVATPRNSLFMLLIAASALLFLTPLRHLLALCMSSEQYSYIPLIPAMAVGLLYLERERIFERVRYSRRAGIMLIALGALAEMAGAVLSARVEIDILLTIEIVGLVTIWIGSFVLCFGTGAARAGAFALHFSLLLVPLPHAVIVKPLEFVQHGSAEITGFLFAITGAPVFREGLTFSLPRLRFIVAAECSGIHSTIALFIASLLAGHFYLSSSWKRVVLVLIVLPIVCFTNGLRMFVLAMLANYVDMAFFTGNLHHRGGVIFFALALVMLGVTVKLLGGRLAMTRQQPSRS